MWATDGQQETTERLADAIRSRREAHAYLIQGPDGSGKRTLALDIFRALNCKTERGEGCDACQPCRQTEAGTHPDITWVRRADKATRVQIDDVREATERLYVTTTQGGHGAVIIEDAHLMTEEAGNALLKTLEEPPEYSVIFLLTEEPQGTLGTIESRCVSIHLKPTPESEIERILTQERGMPPDTAQTAARQSDGWLGRAITLASDPSRLSEHITNHERHEQTAKANIQGRFATAAAIEKTLQADRTDGVREIAAWQSWWRDRMLDSIGAGQFARNGNSSAEVTTTDAITALEIAEQAITDVQANSNARTTLERMMLMTPAIS